MTAYRICCIPLQYDTERRDVFVPSGPPYYVQDNERPWRSAYTASLMGITRHWQLVPRRGRRVAGKPKAVIYKTIDGYIGVLIEAYEVTQ